MAALGANPVMLSRRITLLCVFFFHFCLYSLMSSGTLHNPDSATRMMTAITLARRGSVGIKESDFPGLDLSKFELGLDRHGEWVEMFNEGQSLLMAPMLWPVVAVADRRHSDPRKACEFLTAFPIMPALSALAMVALWEFFTILGCSPRQRLLATLCVSCASPALVHASNGHQELLLEGLLVSAWCALKTYLDRPRRGLLVWCGICLGGLPLIRYSSIHGLPLFAVWLSWALAQQGQSRKKILTDVGLLAGVAVAIYSPQFYLNYVKTGSPFLLPHVLWGWEPGHLLTLPALSGLAITLFSPAESVFLYQPVLLLSLAVLPWVWRRLLRADLVVLFVYALVLYVMLLRWISWPEEIAWGPRTLVHLGFIMAIPSCMALIARIKPWIGKAFILATLLGFAVNFLGTLYPSELDFSAQRLGQVYGPDRVPAWINFPLYRAGDLANIGLQGCHVPSRFQTLEGSERWFVPQWWWVRLWIKRDLGAPRPVILVVVLLLLGGMAASAALLLHIGFTPIKRIRLANTPP